MAASPKRPWHMFYPLVGMLVICMAWSGYWFFAFSGARELVKVKRSEFAGRGVQLDCAREAWGGFPFRFEFQCDAPALQLTQANETYRLKSAKLLAVAQAYNPLHVLFLITGPTAIDSTATGPQAIIHDQALISVTLNVTGDFDISSETAKVEVPGMFSAAQLRFFAKGNKTALDLAGNAEQLVMFNLQDAPIPISAAEFLAQTNTPFGRQPLAIRALKISQGPVDFTAQGSISLDPQHRFVGQLSSQTNDIDRLMKIISPVFAMSGDDSAAIKNLVSLTGSDPSTKTTKADFTARDGALYWGPFKLADLAPLY